MKRIKNVKLGFNKDAEVTVVADVEMNGKNDIDLHGLMELPEDEYDVNICYAAMSRNI